MQTYPIALLCGVNARHAAAFWRAGKNRKSAEALGKPEDFAQAARPPKYCRVILSQYSRKFGYPSAFVRNGVSKTGQSAPLTAPNTLASAPQSLSPMR